jgi:hypothetical protein
LEQAEQLMRSSEVLGPETKPLNLFYGLSQGMRAVAAAKIPGSRDWVLRGHGITHERSLDRPVSTIKVRDSPEDRGSFRAVAGLLNSPSLPDPIELGDLLAALPLELPASTWTDRPHAIEVDHIDQNNGASLVMSPHVYARTRGWVDMVGLTDPTVRTDCSGVSPFTTAAPCDEAPRDRRSAWFAAGPSGRPLNFSRPAAVPGI